MNLNPTPFPPEFLQERIEYLEESNRRFTTILDMLASSGGFQGDLIKAADAESIFRATEVQVRRVLDCEKIGCMTSLDDGTFQLATWDPADGYDALQEEIRQRILDGSFAWALHRNQAILTPMPGNRTLLLHVIETRTRIRGMFVATLAPETPVNDGALSALSIILYTAAYAIENMTLYGMLREQMATLEEKVEQRTRDLETAREAAEAGESRDHARRVRHASNRQSAIGNQQSAIGNQVGSLTAEC